MTFNYNLLVCTSESHIHFLRTNRQSTNALKFEKKVSCGIFLYQFQSPMPPHTATECKLKRFPPFATSIHISSSFSGKSCTSKMNRLKSLLCNSDVDVFFFFFCWYSTCSVLFQIVNHDIHTKNVQLREKCYIRFESNKGFSFLSFSPQFVLSSLVRLLNLSLPCEYL